MAEDPYTTGTISPIEPNQYGKMLADALRSSQDWLNSKVYHKSGVGLGDLLMGEAPRLAEDISYGDYGIRRTGHGYNLDPAYLDLTGVLSVPASIAKSTVKAGLNPMSRALRNWQADNLRRAKLSEMFHGSQDRRIADVPVLNDRRNAMLHSVSDPSRRKFIQGAGAVAGIAATAPALLPKLLREGVSDAGKAAAINVGKNTAARVISPSIAEAGAKYAESIARSWMGSSGMLFVTPRQMQKALSKDAVEAATDYMDDLARKYGDEFDPEGFVLRSAEDPELQIMWDVNLKDGKKLSFDQISEAQHDLLPTPYKGRGKNPAMRFLEELPNDQEREVVERWLATGKWPEGTEDLMKYFNINDWYESKGAGMPGGIEMSYPESKAGEFGMNFGRKINRIEDEFGDNDLNIWLDLTYPDADAYHGKSLEEVHRMSRDQMQSVKEKIDNWLRENQ